MADETFARAQRAFESLCNALDKNEWHYEKDEEKLSINCGVQGDDLPMALTIKVDAGSQLIILLSHLPFIIPEDKRLDVAIATSIANYGMVDGSFDYDITDGSMFFRMTSSFIDSEVGSELFDYMVTVSCSTIDDYNDKFLMIGKGLMSIEDFIAKE